MAGVIDRAKLFTSRDPRLWFPLVAGGVLIGAGLRMRTRTGAAIALTGGAIAAAAIGFVRDVRSRAGVAPDAGIYVDQEIVIAREPNELYQFWRDFENLPQIMSHLESVTVNGDRSHWVAKGPVGFSVEWDAEIVDEEENEMIVWQSVPGATVPNEGVVSFESADEGGTLVRVWMRYSPPAGRLGSFFARMLGEEPSIQLADDLARFRDLMEQEQPAAI